MQERNVDAACIIGVIMYYLVLARRQHSFDRLDEQAQHESILDLAYSQQVRTGASFICTINDASCAIF